MPLVYLRCLGALLLPICLMAQTAPPAAETPAVKTAGQGADVETGKRIFGVLPNYKTVEKMGVYEPIPASEKFKIAAKDSFDWPEFLVAGAITGLNQMTGQTPEWGQGLKGYGKRYAASLADQTIGNFLTEAILPSVLHHDPRYFRLGPGHSAPHRLAYALSWVVVGKTDSGHATLNISELAGSGASAALGWYYYPRQERQFGPVRDRFVTQVSFDAASSMLKEYWPDIHEKLLRRRHHN